MGHRALLSTPCPHPTQLYICWKALLKSFPKMYEALRRDAAQRNSDRRRRTKNGTLRLVVFDFSTSGTSHRSQRIPPFKTGPFACALCTSMRNMSRPGATPPVKVQGAGCLTINVIAARQQHPARLALRARLFGRVIHGTARCTSQVVPFKYAQLTLAVAAEVPQKCPLEHSSAPSSPSRVSPSFAVTK